MNPKVGIGVIIVYKNKVLLGKRIGRHGTDTWCFPGGHLEFMESVEECAKRETLEETGLEVFDIQPLTFTNDIFSETNKHYVTLFVTTQSKTEKVELKEPEKFATWNWFEWDNLPQPLFLPIQNLLRFGIKPF